MASAAPLIIIMLLVGGIALWGFLTDWTFSGLLPREGARCTPGDDEKVENAKQYVYDEDKECTVVNMCKRGWKPNSSNTACIAESTGESCTVSNPVPEGVYKYNTRGVCVLDSCDTGWQKSGTECISTLSGDPCNGSNPSGVYNYDTNGECVLDSLSYDVETPIMCTDNDVGSGEGVAVYRYTGGVELRHYPDPTTAGSWDPDWGTTLKEIDCAGLEGGNPMPYKGAVGEYVKCTSNGFGSDDEAVYIIKENNVLSPSSDHTGEEITAIDCVGYTLDS